jgi:hypothetical protein
MDTATENCCLSACQGNQQNAVPTGAVLAVVAGNILDNLGLTTIVLQYGALKDTATENCFLSAVMETNRTLLAVVAGNILGNIDTGSSCNQFAENVIGRQCNECR